MSDLIECDCCGRSFKTEDGAEMLAAIKGPCPSCVGTFRPAVLSGASSAAPGPPEPPAGR